MNSYSIKSKVEKIDAGFHILSAYFHQRHIYRKWGLPHVVEYNGNDQSQNLKCPLFCMLKYMKSDFMCT